MDNESQSRVENILQNKIDNSAITADPQSRVEELLVKLGNLGRGSSSGGTVDLTDIRTDISNLKQSVGNIKNSSDLMEINLDSLQKAVDQNKSDVDAVIESIENNIEAMDEEMHEPEILNAPIEIEGAFPSVLGGTFNNAKLDEMYLWTYFVPKEGNQLFEKQAGMETIEDLIIKAVDLRVLNDMKKQLSDLQSKYDSLYQACVKASIIDG